MSKFRTFMVALTVGIFAMIYAEYYIMAMLLTAWAIREVYYNE
jgi:hypothetical protein